MFQSRCGWKTTEANREARSSYFLLNFGLVCILWAREHQCNVTLSH